MKARARPLKAPPAPPLALLEEARAWLRTAAMLARYAVQHGLPLPAAPFGRDDDLPTTLPFGARTVGPYAPCTLCVTLAPLEGQPESVGTWLRYGDTPLCRRHARAVVPETR